MTGERFYEAELPSGPRRSAPAALRNREPIADVLAEWLPCTGLVLEIASGTGEHALYFAGRFPDLEWQPSDCDSAAIESITAWRSASARPNLHAPLQLDASASDWPSDRADAVLSINMVHISPWEAAIGLLDGAARLLPQAGVLILYGPWITDGQPTAASNLAFDADLRRRNPAWGLRRLEDSALEASGRGFRLAETRSMPANNLMALFTRPACRVKPSFTLPD